MPGGAYPGRIQVWIRSARAFVLVFVAAGTRKIRFFVFCPTGKVRLCPVLVTLAGLQLEGSRFTRPKPLLLLAYLSLEGARERRFLRELFWPGDADAATHLRVTVQRLRQASPDTLEVAGEWLSSNVRTDAQEVLTAQESADPARVLELYKGAFLAGANLPALGEELEEWLYRTRELLAASAQAAWMHRASEEARKGAFEVCARQAEQAYLLPAAPEPDADRLFRLHALLLAGESHMASEVRRDAQLLGVKPLETVEAARAHWQRRTHRASSRLPTPTTTFVGRIAQIETIRERLSSPECRWLTLLGPGGMGKTRLALETARQLASTPAYPDGVFWVPLENVLEASTAAQRVHEALVGPSNATGEPISQVEDWLHDRCALLVLDNAEQVESIGGVLERWAGKSEDSRLLVTSRERLAGPGEWVLTLEGLPLGNRKRPDLQSEAAKLFVARSKQVRIGNSISEADIPAVLEICEVLDGVPLALELAATWLDVIEPAQLVQELRADLRLLDQSAQGQDVNLRVAFERSWNKLSEREQQILSSLSIFEDGFTREAAQKITGSTISDVFSLVNRSLVKPTSTNRYALHPLIRSYAREKLEGMDGRKAKVQALHDDYFFDFLLEHGKNLTDPDSSVHFDALDREIDNLLVAWLNSGKTKLEKMRISAPFLRRYFIRKSDSSRGEVFFTHTLSICQIDKTYSNAFCICFKSSLAIIRLFLTENTEKAEELIKEIPKNRINCKYQNCYECIYSYLVEGFSVFIQKDYVKAKKIFKKGFLLAKKHSEKDLSLLFKENNILARHALGEKNLHDELLEIIRECEAIDTKIGFYNTLGYYYMEEENYESAIKILLEAIPLTKLVKYQSVEVDILSNLAHCYLLISEIRQGLFFANHACEKSEFIDSSNSKAYAFESRGRIHLEIGNFKEAINDLGKCLESSWRQNNTISAVDILIDLCGVYVKANLHTRAQNLLANISEIIELDDNSKVKMEKVLEKTSPLTRRSDWVAKRSLHSIISSEIEEIHLQRIISA